MSATNAWSAKVAARAVRNAADWAKTWDQMKHTYRETVWATSAPKHGLVFTAPGGGALHRSTVTHALQDCLAAARIHRHRFHFLRHRNASVLLALGVSPRALQDHLGHADFSTTMNTYAHLVPDAPLRIAAVVDTARGAAIVAAPPASEGGGLPTA